MAIWGDMGDLMIFLGAVGCDLRLPTALREIVSINAFIADDALNVRR